MAFKDILVALTSYPEPSPISVVDDAVSIAAAFGAHLTALSCETHVQVPGHFLSGSFANIPGIIAGEGAKSRQNAQDLLAAFDKSAERAGVPQRDPSSVISVQAAGSERCLAIGGSLSAWKKRMTENARGGG